MSRTLFSLAGFQVITIGRFWVIAEAEEFQRIGFNPPEIMKKLKVEIDRGVYRRSQY